MREHRWRFAVSAGHPGLQALKPSWCRLAEAIPTLDFVQSPDWAQAYLDHLAPSPDDVLWITAHEGEDLVAVLPVERVMPGGRDLRMHTHPHMTLADVVAQPASAQVWPALWDWLQHDSGLSWDRLVIHKMSADAMLAGWLSQVPLRLALSSEIDGCAVLDCDRSFESLLKGASANHRSSLNRGLKRAEQMGTLRYATHADPQSLNDAMPHFLAVEASGWKGAQGGAVACSAELMAFYDQLARDLGARGQCEIDLLWLDDRAIATVFWFRTGGQLHLQKIAYLEELANIGPGKLIMREALMRACADPTLRGVSFITRCPWADGWRTEVTPVWTHTLYRESWRGRALHAFRRYAKKLKGAAKPVIANVLRGFQARKHA